MGVYSVAETKAHLSEIIKRVEAGEEVTITKRGEPIATLVGVSKQKEQPINWKRIGELRKKLPRSKTNAAELIREMRDAGF